jgi:hypothetical protein
VGRDRNIGLKDGSCSCLTGSSEWQIAITGQPVKGAGASVVAAMIGKKK